MNTRILICSKKLSFRLSRSLIINSDRICKAKGNIRIKLKEMKDTDTTLLTVEEVSDKLGLTNKTVRKHIRSGRIPAQKLGKRWYISLTDFYKIFTQYMTT